MKLSIKNGLMLAGTGALVLAFLPGTTGANPVSLNAAAPSTAMWLQGPAVLSLSAPPVVLPLTRVGFATSTIFPTTPGLQCSTFSPGQCSAAAGARRCSASNGQMSQCSVYRITPGQAPGGRCSAGGFRGVCSIIPSGLPPVGPSQCSTFGGNFPDANNLNCSAGGSGTRQLCSAQGVGSSTCSVIEDPCRCSVLNPGASTGSFCTTRGPAGATTKGCSAFASAVPGGQESRCSILQSGKGQCTTFGQPPLGACSVFAADGTGTCSIIGQPGANDPCRVP